MRRDTLGKLLGMAGLAGVAATGVVLARDERQRRAYTPEDVRARLHERAELAAASHEWHEEHGAAAPPMIEMSTPRGDGLWVVPAARTRRGRLFQRARWQLNRLPALPISRRRAAGRSPRP